MRTHDRRACDRGLAAYRDAKYKDARAAAIISSGVLVALLVFIIFSRKVKVDAKLFDAVVRDQLERSTDVLLVKAGEYADDTDRLRNFRLAAALQDLGLSEALGGMLAKHIVSIFEMLGEDTADYTIERWNEKITDAINYLLLLKAVVVEEHFKKGLN